MIRNMLRKLGQYLAPPLDRRRVRVPTRTRGRQAELYGLPESYRNAFKGAEKK